MSASSKKKLRNEQQAAKMTERQLAEQKEAKKLKTYTVLFTAVLVVIVALAVAVAAVGFVTNSGIRERNTVALTVGEDNISNAELNYFFIDAVNNFYRTYGSYAMMFGLDTSIPLNEQVINEESGITWADDFLDTAKSNAQTTYALVAEAEANGYTLSEEEIASINDSLEAQRETATENGYGDLDTYLKAMYGKGATEKTFRKYVEMNTLANSYYNYYSASLEFDDAALRSADEENAKSYNAYSYNSYYLAASKFLEGGTTDEEGNTTYSDKEQADALAAAEEAAAALVGDEIKSIEDLDAAVAALPFNADAANTVTTTPYEDVDYASISTVFSEWVTDSARKAGDMTYIANTSTSTGEDGSETTTTLGYYVIYFVGSDDNNYPLANVRHILVPFEGGSYDATTGTTTYSQTEKLLAQVRANDLLGQWESGDATEDSFAELANTESTDEGSNSNGGLYEDVIPGQMVTNFNDWCFAEGRKAGDTGIVETEYGYHVMYYSGDSETLYRDYLIANELRSAETSEWYTALTEAMPVTEKDLRYIEVDLTLGGY